VSDVSDGFEKALWSVAIPGFGQFLNRKYFKGIVLIILEFTINNQSNINTAIVLSFNGKTTFAVGQTNYQWLMFYPCVYLFAIYDAYRDGTDNKAEMLYIPFALSAYIGTVGVVYSASFKIAGVLLGPIFCTLLFMVIGFGLGFAIRVLVLKVKS
jgi:hypothetical protein